MDVANPRITLCSDNTYCCGAENSTCCDEKLGFKIAATTTGTFAYTLTVPTTTGSRSESATASSLTSPGTTSTSDSTVLSTGSPATAAPVSKSKSKDNSVAIGAGVGVPLGVLLVALVAGFFFWKHRQNKKKAVELPDVEGAGYPNKNSKGTLSNVTSPETQYTSEGIEEGGVMSALAAGTPQSANSHSVHPLGGEIHEIDPGIRDQVHELPVEGRQGRKNVYDYPGNEKI
jgi:hypothetical protein